MNHKTGSRILSGALAALLFGTSLPLPVFAEEIATPGSATSIESEQEDWLAVNGVDEVLFGVLPDEPTGAYMSSRGLPVATGDTKLSISPWHSELSTEGNVLDAEALNTDTTTMTASYADGTDYAIVPLLVQVEYPANGSTTNIELPEGVELLSYDGTRILEGEEREKILYITHEESAASAQGIFVMAQQDFSVTVRHEGGDTTLEKTLQVQITDTQDEGLQQPEAGIAVQADRPTPSVTTGKITRCEYVVNTWLIWFNGTEAYCCDNGLNGKPDGCPTYSYTATSTIDAGQYTGDHYTTQISIWGGIGQLSLDDGIATYALEQEEPVEEELSEEEALLDFCSQIYNETQMHIIRTYPDSEAAQIYRGSALQLMQGVAPLADAGYYTFIYSPAIGGWQRTALIGPPITDEPEPTPEPTYDASWTAVVSESATASFDVTMITKVNKNAGVTHEALSDAQITVRPAEAGGALDGGNWSISPAEQIIRTEHGDGSVSWHYTGSVTREAGRSDYGTVTGYPSQSEADAAANAQRAAAEQRLREEARTAAQNAANAAAQQAAAVARQFVLSESGVPHGFAATDSSNQTITVQPNGEATATITNTPWRAKVEWNKRDSMTGTVVANTTQFEIQEWDASSNQYAISPNYTVVRKENGIYTVRVTNGNYTDWEQGFLYYTQQNQGKFRVVEKQAPHGYNTDPWTLDVVIDEPNKVIDATGADNAAKDGPWKAKVMWNKFDALTGKLVAAETGFTVYEWSRNKQDYLPSEHYSVVRLADGKYTVQVDHTYQGAEQGYLYYTESNEGKFEIRESLAPHGFNLDPWTLAVVIDKPDQTIDATGKDNAAKDSPWSASVQWEKLDAITGGRLTEDTEFQLLEWSEVEKSYCVSANYKVIRKTDGTYTVRVSNADFAPIWQEGQVYFSEQNLGKFKIEEVTAAYGYTLKTDASDTPWSAEFVIRENGQVVSYMGKDAVKNRPQGTKVIIDKVDSETGNRIAAEAAFTLYEWNAARDLYEVSPNYAITRKQDGTYMATCLHKSWKLAQDGYLYFEDTLCDTREDTANHDGTTSKHAIHYSDYDMTNYPNDRAYTNDGQFIIVEHTAPKGYFGDWTDIQNPGKSGSDLGKRAYYIRLTGDGKTIKLGNADYNADVLTENKGGILVETPDGTVTVEINPTVKNADRTYTTDPTGLAANEDRYTEIAGKDVFKNTHVMGYLELSKVDLDAAATLANGTHGTAILDGAVYDLYAAENIRHPDGVSGVVDYSAIIDANGNPIWHTTVFDGNHWNESYLPVLQKDHLVASAAIKDGKLAFANLYMGRYYLVERATGIVLPVDENGKLYQTGFYPERNKRLELTGKEKKLSTKGSEYSDYVYKNRFSAVAEGRAPNGTKTYDGYYLSYAKGYLCDEVNHYAMLAYGGESAYLIRGEAQSEDAVLKSGLSLQKLVSTTGQPSPALKLQGAGFTVFRIDRLSKADKFKMNPDGSYNAQSILDAYRRDNYDNATLKYDFTDEMKAIATMYENDPDLVAAYNAMLTADGDNAYGSGNGWQATGKPNEYRLAEIFTNEEGRFTIEGLPYGEYLVVETTIPKDVFQADPFVVKVDATSPQSAFSVPAGSTTKPSNSYMTYNILDEELEGYLRVVKTDAETGKAVCIANTAFALYKFEPDGTERRIAMVDPASGDPTRKTDVFYTDETGSMKTPEKLPLGKYRIVELAGPNGFYLDEQYNVVFELTSERVWQVIGNATNDMDEYIISEEYQNHETLGLLTIRKLGKTLTALQDGQFVYETDALAGAVYEIRAHEDIATGDRQGT